MLAFAAFFALAGCRGCEGAVVDWLEAEAEPIEEIADLEPILDRAAERRLILLGEATHGTEEFYAYRRAITQALVERGAIDFVAVEGDWSFFLELNAWVRGRGPRAEDEGAGRELLRGLDRWPEWMWKNQEFVELAEWLRAWNAERPKGERVGLYGLDIYSPEAAARDVIEAVGERVGAAGADVPCVREAAAPGANFERRARGGETCEDELGELIDEIEGQGLAKAEDREVYAALSARALRQAGRHFAAEDDDEAWNARASNFFDVASALLEREGEDGAGVVWAHNTHIGDDEATPMADSGRVNVGGLARRELGRGAIARVGFATDRGEVVAAPRWGAEPQALEVPPSKDGSLEAYFRDHGPARFFVSLEGDVPRRLARSVPHWAVGVVWDGEGEGTYVPSDLDERYEALIWLEETSALRPLD